MAKDLLYYVDKQTKVAHELGEIQSDFNMNIVIDGTKDSMQVQVYDYNGVNLQPYTLICHKATNTWWIVKSDKVKRYANDSGYYYQHNLALQGAIELLNARDLTDIGFNANTYTIDQFIKRLLKLSTFEWSNYTIYYGNNVDKDKIIDFVKSYENYTLLTALRDFLNCFNCEIKMRFLTPTNNSNIGNPIFDIIPRTGDIDKTPIDIDEFDDIRETKNFDKESFGTTVVSNAQNVIGTQAKTVPLVGGYLLTGQEWNTPNNSAYIKLPSNAWKVNWLRAISPVRLFLGYGDSQQISTLYADSSINRYLSDDIDTALEELYESIRNSSDIGSQYKETLIEQIESRKQDIIDICNHSSITFYNNTKYEPDYNGSDGNIIKEDDVPYIPILDNAAAGANHRAHKITLMDEESAKLVKNQYSVYIWKRGSDKITNFQNISEVYKTYMHTRTDLYYLDTPYLQFEPAPNYFFNLYVACGWNEDYGGSNRIAYQHIRKSKTIWQVNYVPMSDLKVKQDNDNETKDIKFYNQNGKLNDSVGLSKIIDSHSKEIQNETITRYMHYHKFSDIPTIGTMVNNNGNKYVINNISYDFFMQEQTQGIVSYYIECEFTLAPYISTKSIMTNPNTNVRDYGIPQQYNVKRRQTYRDYWDFEYAKIPFTMYADTPYYDISKIINFGSKPQEIKSHTAFIKTTYDEMVDDSLYWYYQLSTTVYSMSKSFYEVVDFNDNNIIGYDCQSSITGFDMSHIWQTDQQVTITTPVSYVDDNGKLKGIDIQFLDQNTTDEIYKEQTSFSNNSLPLSPHVFIDESIYYSAFTTETYSDTLEESLTSAPLSDNFRGFFVNAVDFPISQGADRNTIQIIGVSVVDDVSGATLTDFTIETYYNGNDIDYFKLISNNTTSDPAYIRYDRSYEVTITYTYTKPLVSKGDYVISEPDYNKDSIEVPVFQYSCQVGDTKNVECGDQFFNVSKQDYTYLYTFVIRPKNSTTQLNIGKWATEEVVVDEVSQTYNEYVVQNGVQIGSVIETDGRTSAITFVLYNGYVSNVDNGVVLSSSGGAIAKTLEWVQNNVIGKDLAIYRYVVRDKDATVVDKQLLFLLHDVSSDSFITGTPILFIKANYYKLK